MIYIYCCKDYEKDLNNYANKKGQIKRFLDRIKKMPIKEIKQSLETIGYEVPLYKKDFDNQYLKLIIEIKSLLCEREHILYIRRLLPHESEYSSLITNSQTWYDKNPIPGGEKKKASELVSRKRKERIDAEKREVVPDDLNNWLKKPSIEPESTVVYESEVWTSKELGTYYWSDFYDALYKIVNNEVANERTIDNERGAQLVDEGKKYILYEKFQTEERSVFFLHAHFDEQPTEEELKKILDKNPVTFDGGRKDLERIIPYAKRAYPDWVLSDKDIWGRIQGVVSDVDRDRHYIANLALSGEEEEILAKARMPIFINGQAGSGKSTMLFFLFAEYCYWKIKGDKDYKLRPLFLTYNEHLLEEAKASIKVILKNNSKYLITDKKALEKVDEVFYPFQSFILEKLLNPNDRHRFSLDKYVSFQKFRIISEKDCRLRQKSDYSPELVWHVIRTFIKGYSVDAYLSPADYQGIPRDDKDVDNDTYEGIYDTIWKQWYYKRTDEDKDFWDDQDLIKFVLAQSEWQNRYPVIFCDEAQDFTKIELELLLKLSCFMKYDLSDNYNIPFAFAGDPLQTLNPTGFSWERLTATFYDKLRELNPTELQPHKPIELKKNYRSTEAIVRLANLIQFCRYKYLRKKELDPQKWWQMEQGVVPCKFILEEGISAEDLDIESTVIIVPSEVDQEKEFVEGDEVLKSVVNFSTVDPSEANVFSPGTAKGLEFPKVILYKFGEAAEGIIDDLINETIVSDENKYMKASHFFNKLYVAITRARESLFIIDSPKGNENLWKYFTQDSDANVYGNVDEKERNTWSEKIGYVHIGKQGQITELKEKDPITNAKITESGGYLQSDPHLLKRAAHFYRKAGREEKALECEAGALELEKKWEEAGEKFASLKNQEKASNCFWKGKCWNKLYELHLEDILEKYMMRKQVAKFMKSSQSDIDMFLTSDLKDYVDPKDGSWQAVVAELTKRLKSYLKQEEGNWLGVAQSVKATFIQLGFSNNLELDDVVAEYFFKGENWDKAISHWEKIDKTEHSHYFWAKFKFSTTPTKKLSWLSKIQPVNKEVEQSIIEVWDSMENRQTEIEILSKEAKNRILEIFDKKKCWENVFVVSLSLDAERAIEVYHEHQLDKTFGIRILDKILQSQDSLDWLKAIDFIEEDPQYEDQRLKVISSIAGSNITPEKAREELSQEGYENLRIFVNNEGRKSTELNSRHWHKIGTALERVDWYFVSSLSEFYEPMMKSSQSPADARFFARQRWIVVKRKQIEHEKEHKKRERKIEKWESEVADKMDRWKIKKEDLTDFPEPILEDEIEDTPADDQRHQEPIADETIHKPRSEDTSIDVQRQETVVNIDISLDLNQNLRFKSEEFVLGGLRIKAYYEEKKRIVIIDEEESSKMAEIPCGEERKEDRFFDKNKVTHDSVNDDCVEFQIESKNCKGLVNYAKNLMKLEIDSAVVRIQYN